MTSSAIKSTSATKNKRYGSKSYHVYLQEKYLRSIPKVKNRHEIQVLYLYSNIIDKIDNLDDFANLTSLYLQDNNIKTIENLNGLKKLKKLFLGRNCISVLENLNNLPNLEELHLEKQKLVDGTALCFDPRTLCALSSSLEILNISNNNISSISCLSILGNLKSIDASFNDLDDLNEIVNTVQRWYCLQEANFKGNSVSKLHRYKESIIAKCFYLESLDGKNVSALSRKFLKSFEEERKIRGSKHSINLTEVIQGIPKTYPPALTKAVSASMIKKTLNKNDLLDDFSTFDERNAVHIVWKALPKKRPYVVKKQPTSNKMDKVVKSAMVVNSLPKIG